LSGLAVLVLLAVAFLGKVIGSFVLGLAGVLIVLWALFVIYTF
jgi:hypothetical protein